MSNFSKGELRSFETFLQCEDRAESDDEEKQKGEVDHVCSLDGVAQIWKWIIGSEMDNKVRK